MVVAIFEFLLMLMVAFLASQISTLSFKDILFGVLIFQNIKLRIKNENFM